MTVIEQTTPLPTEEKKQLQVVERVTKYETVTNLVSSVVSFYNTAKEKNNLVKIGCETVESGVEKGIQWVTPKVEPLTQTTLYKKCSEPLITTVDQLGCASLDALEQLNSSYQNNLKPNVEKKIELVRSKAQDAVDATVHLAEKTKEFAIQSVEPVDNYLKDSLLGTPITKILDQTEVICDRIFPEAPQEIKEGKAETTADTTQVQVAVTSEGPIFRSGKLSKRVQRGLAKKLTNLRLRTPEQIKAMAYTVDLIQYAASNLEKGVHSTNEFFTSTVQKGVELGTSTVHKGVEMGTQKIHNVKETSQKIVDSTKTRVEVLTKDALDSVNKAIEVLSQQLPADQVKKFSQAKDFVIQQSENLNLQQFKQLVPVALNKLNTMKSVIGDKITSNQTFSHPFISNVLHRLSVIREGLTGILTSKSSTNLLDVTEEIQDDKKSLESDESTSVEADDDQDQLEPVEN